MNSGDLAHHQAERLRNQVARQLRYLAKLVRRMDSLGFPPDDPLYVAALRACHACHELHVRCHYAAVRDGVGMDARPRPPRDQVVSLEA